MGTEGQVHKLKEPRRSKGDDSEFILEDSLESPAHLILVFSTASEENKNGEGDLIRIQNPTIK
ncbi:MAG: hypothetical protein R3C24_11365 [Cyanobacteriota/Melainabacteria group bacterium]